MGVLVIRALLFGSMLEHPDLWKLSNVLFVFLASLGLWIQDEDICVVQVVGTGFLHENLYSLISPF